MSWAAFVVYIGFYWRVLEPAKAMAASYAAIQKGLVSAGRIFEILDAENDIKESEKPIELTGFSDSIEFRGVSFNYGGEPVLEDINLTIPKGKTVAIVGPSGAGKSTLADLIPRFWECCQGEILVDGHDIRSLSIASLRSIMGIVTQEPILFNDSIYGNITFGMENVSDRQVEEAAAIANADEFIARMDKGFQTNIGDRGAKLSGGQRQRLAIARAVLKNPPFLILDEATSSLDTESERLVQDALSKVMSQRTSIVIAHRLSTIQYADEIVVLQKGQIIERGKHDDLIALGGVYKKLTDLQSIG
jgi:subfamily B ATP-binding cassette protein MsbA